MADDEGEKGYTWETEYEKTWEALKEDSTGSLQASVDEIVHHAKRRKLLERPINIRLGMMRHLFVILDMSQYMQEQDLKPTRMMATLKLLEHFIEEYFDQNPISQLGILATLNKRAETITQLGGNPKRHISMLKGLAKKTCEGEPSLQNCLELALDTLRHMPGHASREVLVIYGSLTTCDPGDIHQTIKTMETSNVRCSVIGLSAEVRVCKSLCQQTHGKYDVILDETHFKDLLIQHMAPPPASTNAESSLIRMGFPHHLMARGQSAEKPSFCMCHLDTKTGCQLGTGGYYCPQCKSKYCELPVECKACGLTLVSAPHLARSYHHLFPQETFQELPASATNPRIQQTRCFSCQNDIAETTSYRCGRCNHVFCLDCDLFIHETLHSCPGCASSRSTQQVDLTFPMIS